MMGPGAIQAFSVSGAATAGTTVGRAARISTALR